MLISGPAISGNLKPLISCRFGHLCIRVLEFVCVFECVSLCACVRVWARANASMRICVCVQLCMHASGSIFACNLARAGHGVVLDFLQHESLHEHVMVQNY